MGNNENKIFDLTTSLKKINDDVTIKNVNIRKEFDVLSKNNKYLIGFEIEVSRITPDTINLFYSKVVDVVKSKNLSIPLSLFTITIENLTFIHPSGFSMEWRRFIPVHIMNSMKYGQPNLQTIDDGQHSLVLPKNPVTNNEDLDKVIKIKNKLSNVYYELYKKGNINGNDYILKSDPKITIEYIGGFRTELEMRSFRPLIESQFETINGNPIKNVSRELQVEIGNLLHGKFLKHNIMFKYEII